MLLCIGPRSKEPRVLQRSSPFDSSSLHRFASRHRYCLLRFHHNLDILLGPSSYKLCGIISHRPDSIARVPVPVPLLTQPAPSFNASPHHSTPSGSSSTISRQVEESGIIAGGLRMIRTIIQLGLFILITDVLLDHVYVLNHTSFILILS
jgi:hypothetical protein